MGQLLKRIFRVAKSYYNDTDEHPGFDSNISSDSELNKIFEELKNEKQFHQKSQNTEHENKKQNYDINLKNACNILSITPDASEDEIKSAYLKLIKEYHPDKVVNLGSELKILAERKTQEINQAYDILRKIKGF